MSEGLNELRDAVHETAREKGWHDEPRTHGDFIALMHSELSEALESIREGREPNDLYVEDAKPEGVPSELADAIIRILDYCGLHDIDISQAVQLKMAYNSTRPHRHGGKRL